MQSLISCIITTYNRKPEILKRAVDSVFNQSYKNIELIVVNDCPENKYLCTEIQKLIDSYSSKKIFYIVHDCNMGACQARNTGINASKGEYIALLDDDDEWVSTKLEEQIKLFDKENVGLVYCDSIIERDRKKNVHHCVPKACGENIVKALLYGNFIGGNSFPLMKKGAIISVDLYDVEMKALQDLDMWIRIAQKYECVYCPKPLVINHISKTSITTISDNRVSGFKRITVKYKYLYDRFPEIYHIRMISMAGELLAVGRFFEAWYFYKRGIKIKCFDKKINDSLQSNSVKCAKSII